jgi:hypothetical protein
MERTEEQAVRGGGKGAESGSVIFGAEDDAE